MFNSYSIELSTNRLLLRNVQNEDVDQLLVYANDVTVAEMMNGSIPYPYSIEEAKNWVLKHTNDSLNSNSISWGIIEKSKSQFVGSIQIRKIDQETARLSYWIGKPFRNNGFASEAARLVVDFSFRVLKLKKIQAEHLLINPSSGVVLMKVGFKFVKNINKTDGYSNKNAIFSEYCLE